MPAKNQVYVSSGGRDQDQAPKGNSKAVASSYDTGPYAQWAIAKTTIPFMEKLRAAYPVQQVVYDSDRNIPDAEVRKALERVKLLSLVDELPNGIDMQIGEKVSSRSSLYKYTKF